MSSSTLPHETSTRSYRNSLAPDDFNITSSPATTMATPICRFSLRPRGWRSSANIVRPHISPRSITGDVIQHRSFALFPTCWRRPRVHMSAAVHLLENRLRHLHVDAVRRPIDQLRDRHMPSHAHQLIGLVLRQLLR